MNSLHERRLESLPCELQRCAEAPRERIDASLAALMKMEMKGSWKCGDSSAPGWCRFRSDSPIHRWPVSKATAECAYRVAYCCLHARIRFLVIKLRCTDVSKKHPNGENHPERLCAWTCCREPASDSCRTEIVSRHRRRSRGHGAMDEAPSVHPRESPRRQDARDIVHLASLTVRRSTTKRRERHRGTVLDGGRVADQTIDDRRDHRR